MRDTFDQMPMNQMNGEAKASIAAHCMPLESDVSLGIFNLRAAIRAVPLQAAQYEQLARDLNNVADTSQRFFSTNRRLGELMDKNYNLQDKIGRDDKRKEVIRALLEGRTEHDEESAEKAFEQVLSDLLGFDLSASEDIGRKARNARALAERERKRNEKVAKEKTPPTAAQAGAGGDGGAITGGPGLLNAAH